MTDAPAPTVVAADVHVVYTVVGRYARRGGPAVLRRMLLRERAPGLREVHAIRGVSFIVRQGEAIGILGANGCGKSSLLRAIAGLIPPRSGAIYVRGQPALLDVSGALMRDLTGEQNVVLGCLAMGMSSAETRDRYDAICEFAGLGESISLPMSTYSSGMAARLRFAIAAAKSHEVLLIDEAPTVVLVSHYLDVIRKSCTRAIWLAQGQIVADGVSEDIVAKYHAWNERQR